MIVGVMEFDDLGKLEMLWINDLGINCCTENVFDIDRFSYLVPKDTIFIYLNNSESSFLCDDNEAYSENNGSSYVTYMFC